jgi:hypothetical protein
VVSTAARATADATGAAIHAITSSDDEEKKSQ